MRFRTVIFVVILFLGLPNTIARVVRLNPLPKCEYGGVVFQPDDSRAGILQAFDTKSGELIWEKRLYDHFIDPIIEEDTVWAYIEGIFVDKDNKRLLIMNSNNTLMSLDIESKDVMVIELTRNITTRIQKRKEGTRDFSELLVLNGNNVMMRFPSVQNGNM